MCSFGEYTRFREFLANNKICSPLIKMMKTEENVLTIITVSFNEKNSKEQGFRANKSTRNLTPIIRKIGSKIRQECSA